MMISQQQAFGGNELARASADNHDCILDAHAVRIVDLFGLDFEAAPGELIYRERSYRVRQKHSFFSGGAKRNKRSEHQRNKQQSRCARESGRHLDKSSFDGDGIGWKDISRKSRQQAVNSR
jgi:hypothetical protein